MTRRSVPAKDAGDYDVRWGRLRDTVDAGGGRAWRFRSAGRPEHHLEFIEWKQGPEARGLLDAGPVAAALDDLDGAGSVESREEWEESA